MMAENHGVVQGDILGPNEFCAFEVGVIIGLFGAYLLLGKLGCICPVVVVEIDCKPVVGNRNIFDTWIFGVAIDWAVRKRLRLPASVCDGSVSEFQDETSIADICVGIFHTRLGSALSLAMTAIVIG